MNLILNKVKDILIHHSSYKQEYINLDTSLKVDMNLNSFDVVSIITEFEDAFDIEIPDKDINRFLTVGDIVEYIQGK